MYEILYNYKKISGPDFTTVLAAATQELLKDSPTTSIEIWHNNHFCGYGNWTNNNLTVEYVGD